jgi:alginate O-acetyltransferase complex protein AlgI
LPKLNSLLQILITFALVCFAWIFFRANTTADAFLIVKNIFSFSGTLYIGETQQFFYCFLGIAFLLLAEIWQNYFTLTELPFKTNHWLKEHLAYAILIILILMLGVFDGGQFIYFQF